MGWAVTVALIVGVAATGLMPVLMDLPGIVVIVVDGRTFEEFYHNITYIVKHALPRNENIIQGISLARFHTICNAHSSLEHILYCTGEYLVTCTVFSTIKSLNPYSVKPP